MLQWGQDDEKQINWQTFESFFLANNDNNNNNNKKNKNKNNNDLKRCKVKHDLLLSLETVQF